jgi:hypothetical protein
MVAVSSQKDKKNLMYFKKLEGKEWRVLEGRRRVV